MVFNGKSLISRMDWVSRTGDINLPHIPFPPARSPPNKKIVYFLQSPYLFTIDRLFLSIVEMLRILSTVFIFVTVSITSLYNGGLKNGNFVVKIY
jgi:hypothetical protein